VATKLFAFRGTELSFSVVENVADRTPPAALDSARRGLGRCPSGSEVTVTDANAPGRPRWLQWIGRYVAYLYLLRVPLLVWVFLLLFPWLAVARDNAASAVLRGIFDVAGSSLGESAFAYFSVTLASLLCGMSVAVTARLVLYDGHRRFHTGQVPDRRGLARALFLLPLVAAPASVVAAVWTEAHLCESPVPIWCEALGTAAGIGAFVALSAPARRRRAQSGHLDAPSRWRWKLLAVPFAWLERGFDRIIALSPEGYVDAGDEQLRARHRFTSVQLVISLLFYLALFVIRMWAPNLARAVPTLCLILVLVTLLCWGLAGLAFFLDRFRVPVLLIVGAYIAAVSLWPESDHFYRTVPQPSYAPPSPREILDARADAPVILVAASGGGIQAEAWTARVLSGLRQDLGERFDHSLALVSGVSGGSVGAMLFLASYDHGRLAPVGDLETYPPVVGAARSSLDDVTWGLVYPDLVWSVVPFLKGVGGGSDRGTALERAWELGDAVKQGTLRRWQEDARAGTRPAVIFNATLVETGDRLLLSTTTLGPSGDTPGRREWSRLYPDRDLPIATAARLSATFPYVTPAARIETPDLFQSAYHVVDGGYYDNFGVSSLVEWLDTGLLGTGRKPPAVFIVEIRAFRSSAETPSGSPKSSHGGIFQTLAPLETLLAVRDTAQLARNEFALSFISRPHVYDVPLRVFTFEYVGGCGDTPGAAEHVPLSWHLTPKERRALADEWKCPQIAKVRAELRAAFGP
jgi:hypothetical protein